MRTLKYVIGAVSFSLLLVFACSKPATLNTDNSISAIQVLDNGSDITATLKSLTIGTTADASGNYPIAFTLPAGAKVENINIKYTINPKAKLVTDLTNLKYKANTPVLIEVQSESGAKRKYSVTISMEEVKASTKEITSFIFKQVDNTALTEDKAGTIDKTAHTITVTVPFGTVRNGLVPTIEFTGKSIDHASGTKQDFTNDFTYTVTADDDSQVTYTVKVTLTEPRKDKTIISFMFKSSDNSGLTKNYEGTITGTNITFDPFPFSTAVTALKPTIIVSDGAKLSPKKSGEANNFSSDVTYTVTAEDVTQTQNYTVKVTFAEPRKDNTIDSFVFRSSDNRGLTKDYEGTVNGTDITIGPFPFSTDVTALIPTIIASDGAKLSPKKSGEANNFTSDVTYTVTAEDVTQTQNYTVRLTFEVSIVTFVFKATKNPALTTDLSGTIDQTAKTITFATKLPFGTDITALIPSIEIKAATVSPANESSHNFSSAVKYTVSAQGLTAKEYTVTISAGNPEITLQTYSQDTRLGAGELAKDSLFKITNLANKEFTFSIGDITGAKVTATNGVANIKGQPEFFKSSGNFIADGIAVNLKLTFEGIEKTFTINKEQYQVRTAADLSAVRLNLGGDYIMMNDITLPPVDGTTPHPELADDYATKGWDPIGAYQRIPYPNGGSGPNTNITFNGTFDGAGFLISNLTIKRADENYVGLFSVILGNNSSVIRLALNGGQIEGKDNVGGISGFVYQGNGLKNCYSTCKIMTSNSAYPVGGLIGDGTSTKIENCYSTAQVTSNSGGGLVGVGIGGFKATNCYWDRETSGKTKSDGSDNSYGKTTAEMKMQSTYVGWDFDKVWGINPDINNGYPYLRSSTRP